MLYSCDSLTGGEVFFRRVPLFLYFWCLDCQSKENYSTELTSPSKGCALIQ
ncbi:hypothetical protein PORCRE_949 [Porphyromonas crevioricanis JCM 15906]|uniref:Uncharacterized protein n=1 Tax=Porphyromonas crevioricanis JCM 15906 TaxID=1305617 RepID=T1DSG4_9PORP|nr:hypothetical protein PORCRE_949 [Porphyromonas crevioricanis JCM 15906]GAD07409.1 hypothetical protein PORCAN_1029 [Porphyromonas crevioricanis JCM 13913]